MNDESGILNWRRWSDDVTLSGQPTEDQFAHLANTGVAHVINLGPYDNKGALKDEAGCLAALGVTYTYIPVDFSNPTEQDFKAFNDAFDTCPRPVHVHCIYNARVSAFMYRRALAKNERAEDAFTLMDGIWRTGSTWSAFLAKPCDPDTPNTYAGYDY